MKLFAGLALFAALVTGATTPASAQDTRAAQAAAQWQSDPANYRVEVRGVVEEGPGGVMRGDGRLRVNIIMTNSVVIEVNSETSGVLTGGDFNPGVFARNLSGGGAYVTSLNDVAAVEVIHHWFWFGPLQDAVDYNIQLRKPTQFFLNAIRLNARLYRKNPLTGVETLVEEREIVNQRPQRMMNYGIWASARVPERMEAPPEIRTREGHVSFTMLVGADGMKERPAAAEMLIDTPGRVVRRSFARNGMAENRLVTLGVDRLRWNAIGRVGLRYRYGDHGPFDRDDLEIEALLVNFCTDVRRGARVCFRRATHYVYGVDNAPIVKLDGDRSGTEAWAPFVTGPR